MCVQVRRILAGEEELLAKLSKALLESYVDDNKEAKWCPSTPHCGNAIKVRLLDANVQPTPVQRGWLQSIAGRLRRNTSNRPTVLLQQGPTLTFTCGSGPSADTVRLVQVDGEPYCEPTCACGNQFCFACTGKPHSPCTCEM